MSQTTVISAALVALISAMAVGMAWLELASWLEAASFVTGAVCVWLTVKQSVWNFPVGLINVATYSVVFLESKLFADAGLQVIYFILGLIGWYLWLFGGEHHTGLTVSRASAMELATLSLLIAIGTITLWRTLHEYGGAATLWDALTASISLASQWLLNRKRLESWIGWILVDAIYVPLYLYKDLYLTALLYGIFLVMAIMGLREWLQSWRAKPADLIAEGAPA